jgi:hypothetical protein
MYVEALPEGSRTRVRFPPPPPVIKAKAPVILGLFFLKSRKMVIFIIDKYIVKWYDI